LIFLQVAMIFGSNNKWCIPNGSPLFTGDAGSGESEIRRHILTHDYLDCIVAMPTDLFYNTNITTYLWFMTNRKPPERKGQVLLIDASGMSQLMKKNLGKKRREFTADCVARIAQAYADFKNVLRLPTVYAVVLFSRQASCSGWVSRAWSSSRLRVTPRTDPSSSGCLASSAHPS
jgi:type I restriction-modification system DNA methylase subunit